MDILCDVMGMKAEYREWNKTEFLPLYISAGYDFKTFATAPGFDTAVLEEELVDIKKQCRIEVWKYDPCIFSYDGFADPVSVALSLEKTSDERIQISIDEMIKKIWTKNE